MPADRGGDVVAGGLLLGRSTAHLDKDAVLGGEHKIYSAQLLDGADVTGQTFKHCTFANISFKGVTLERCEFLNCAFVDCYFRDTTLRNSQLQGCKFADCTFADPTFIDCTLGFVEFRACFIAFADFYEALPTDPGYRYRLADELAREAAVAGDLRDARKYRLVAGHAYEKHAWNLAWASGGVYYAKPRPALSRVKMGATWVARKFNRHLWSYGERGIILARSFFVAGAVIFPAIFWLVGRDDLRQAGRRLGFLDYELLSLDNLVNAPGFSNVVASEGLTRWLIGAEVLAGLVFIGLFISLIFNWIRRR